MLNFYKYYTPSDVIVFSRSLCMCTLVSGFLQARLGPHLLIAGKGSSMSRTNPATSSSSRAQSYKNKRDVSMNQNKDEIKSKT